MKDRMNNGQYRCGISFPIKSPHYVVGMMTFTSMRLGAFGNSYNNTLVATVNRLYKFEVIEYLKERWHGVNDIELATFK